MARRDETLFGEVKKDIIGHLVKGKRYEVAVKDYTYEPILVSVIDDSWEYDYGGYTFRYESADEFFRKDEAPKF